MTALSLLAGSGVVISILALYKERTLATVAVMIVSIALLIMTMGVR